MTAVMPEAQAPHTPATCSHGVEVLACPSCNDLCDVFDQPRWMCPHCPAFGITQAAQKAEGPVAPDKPQTITGYWSLRTDGRGDWRSEWHAVDIAPNTQDKSTHVARIACTPKHLQDDDQAGLCHVCTQDLKALLADVPKLLHHLQIAIVGDHRFVEHGSYIAKVRADDVSLDWGERASTARRRLLDKLVDLCDATGVEMTRQPIVLNHRLRTIDAHLGQLVQRADAPKLAGAFSRAVIEAHRAIDRPADVVYYGDCPKCHKAIHAERVTDPDDVIKCGHVDCDHSISLKRYQDKFVADARGKLHTVGELVTAINYAGVSVTRDQIKGWVRRDTLTARTIPDPDGPKWEDVNGERRLVRKTITGYPLREALTLATEAQKRANETQGRRS